MSVSPKKAFPEDDEMVTITGEDGLVYKVSGYIGDDTRNN